MSQCQQEGKRVNKSRGSFAKEQGRGEWGTNGTNSLVLEMCVFPLWSLMHERHWRRRCYGRFIVYWYVSEMRKLQFVCAVPFRWHFYQSGGTGELNTLHSIRCVKMYAPPNHCHQLHQAFVQWWGLPEAQSRSSSVERWWLDEVKDWWLNFHSLCFVFFFFFATMYCVCLFSAQIVQQCHNDGCLTFAMS